MDKFKVSNKGEITLPLSIRRFLGIEPGDEVRFEIKEGNVILLPSSALASSSHIAALEKFQAIYRENQEVREFPSFFTLKEQRESRGWDDIDDKLFEQWEKEIAGEKRSQ